MQGSCSLSCILVDVHHPLSHVLSTVSAKCGEVSFNALWMFAHEACWSTCRESGIRLPRRRKQSCWILGRHTHGKICSRHRFCIGCPGRKCKSGPNVLMIHGRKTFWTSGRAGNPCDACYKFHANCSESHSSDHTCPRRARKRDTNSSVATRSIPIR